jgi:hypothetical protein
VWWWLICGRSCQYARSGDGMVIGIARRSRNVNAARLDVLASDRMICG